MRRPNLFILGAPRCGTTAMFEFLGAHPEVYPSPIKEPRFFDPELNERSLEEYLALFSGATDQRWLLEATPRYVFVPNAPRRIRELSPGSRAIVMVRDPVEQIRSIHDLAALFDPKPVDLAEAITLDGAELAYWRRVRSGKNLARVLTAFPRDDVHVVVHDDFRADNASEYRRVLEFLGIDASFTPRFQTVLRTSAVRSQTLQRALRRDGGAMRTIARAILPKRVRDAAFGKAARLNRRPDSQPRIDPDLAKELWRELESDVELLSTLLDRDLVALWRR